MKVKVAVLCADASGCPVFHKCEIEVSLQDIAEGVHYNTAIKWTQSLGYEAINGNMIAFDQDDPATQQLESLADWFKGD